MTDHPPLFAFDNSYARELDGFYASWEGAAAPAPKIVRFNADLAEALGLDDGREGTSSGNCQAEKDATAQLEPAE